ncbi:cathepsin D-like [Amphibalanus amphitrite]|uniref:cathepsin D-like n=1 Tax=Amphibalanus amphitrite TaxID=1232801 RepID=UPI001C921F2C|nr:cathepsin D-like [Amphibalanus amphitrite]
MAGLSIGDYQCASGALGADFVFVILTHESAEMLRLVTVLACLGALEAAVVAVPHVQLDVPAPVQPVIGAVLAQRKTAEPATVSLPLTKVDANGQRYFLGEMSVGTPGQAMTVTVDITGPLSYVPSVNCSDPFCTSHKQYDSAASSTYEADGTPFELPYGQNASGVLSKDAISVAGATVSGQTFGEATAVWNSYSVQAPNDGVLGLGFGFNAGEQGVPTIVESMVEQGLIGQWLAGLWLGRGDAGGELTLGGLNDARHSGELTWAPIVLNPEGWAASVESLAVGETSICSENCLVTALSTTPYFFMSMDAAKAVNDALGGFDIGQPGVAGLDCSTLYTLPTLQVDVAGRILEMSPLEYTFIYPFGGGVEMCLSGFVGMHDFDENVTVLGSLFMQKFYTAYDMQNMRVGFADSA